MRRFLKFLLISLTIHEISTDFTIMSAPPVYSLQANVILNGSMQTPPLSATSWTNGTVYGSWRASSNFKIYKICQSLVSPGYTCSSIANLNCATNSSFQAACLDSGFNQIYEQTVTLTSAIYLFSFNWGNSRIDDLNGFTVYINGTSIFNISNYNTCSVNYQQFWISMDAGPTVISFRGTGTTNGLCIFIANVNLQQSNITLPVYPNTTNTTNTTNNTTPSPVLPQLSNSSTQYLFYTQDEYNQLVSSKYHSINSSEQEMSLLMSICAVSQQIILKLVLKYLSEYNNLLLYSYHNRSYSINAKAYLLAVVDYENLNNAIVDHHILKKIGINSTKVKRQAQSKYKYATVFQYPPNNSITSCYFCQLIYFMVRDCIIALVLYYCVLFFRLFFLRYPKIRSITRNSTSKFMILVMIFDGKIEKLVYFMVSDFLMMASSNLLLKMQICFTLIFAIIFLTVVLSYQFLRKNKKRISKNKKGMMKMPFLIHVFLFLFSRILIGFVHRLFVNFPTIQIFALFCLDFLNLFSIIYLAYIKILKDFVLIGFIVLTILNRIALQICFFLWDTAVKNKIQKTYTTLDTTHQILFISYFLIYFIAIFLNLLKFVYSLGTKYKSPSKYKSKDKQIASPILTKAKTSKNSRDKQTPNNPLKKVKISNVPPSKVKTRR